MLSKDEFWQIVRNNVDTHPDCQTECPVDEELCLGIACDECPYANRRHEAIWE